MDQGVAAAWKNSRFRAAYSPLEQKREKGKTNFKTVTRPANANQSANRYKQIATTFNNYLEKRSDLKLFRNYKLE